MHFIRTLGFLSSVAFIGLSDNSLAQDQRPVIPPPPVLLPPAPPLPPGYRPPSPPKPLGDPSQWVTVNDYPATALREERSGVVGFRLLVAPTGKIETCTVTSSSGSADLDDLTCSLVSLRAQFAPAKDWKGKLILGAYSARVRWVIPDILPQPAGIVTTRFEVDAQGLRTGCRIIRLSGPAAEHQKIGPIPCQMVRYDNPFLDSAGRAIGRTVTQATSTAVVSAPTFMPNAPEVFPPPPAVSDRLRPSAGTLVKSYVVELDGAQSECRILAATGGEAVRHRVGWERCDTGYFDEPYKDAAGQPVRKRVTVTETTTIGPASPK